MPHLRAQIKEAIKEGFIEPVGAAYRELFGPQCFPNDNAAPLHILGFAVPKIERFSDNGNTPSGLPFEREAPGRKAHRAEK